MRKTLILLVLVGLAAMASAAEPPSTEHWMRLRAMEIALQNDTLRLPPMPSTDPRVFVPCGMTLQWVQTADVIPTGQYSLVPYHPAYAPLYANGPGTYVLVNNGRRLFITSTCGR